MKQEREYGVPRTHYNDHSLQTITDDSIHSVRTEFYPRRKNTTFNISPLNTNDITKVTNNIAEVIMTNNNN